jgi:tape measure domain-containing protein
MADAKKRVEIDVRTTGAQKAEADLKRLGESGDRGLRAIVGGAGAAERALGLLGPVLARVSAAAAAGLALRQIVRAGDELAGSLNRLGSATGNVTTAAEIYDRLYAASLRTGAGISDSIAAFTRFSVAASDIGATNDQVLRLIAGIQGFGRLAGTSAAEMSAATLQLGQALASGTLQGDELRSILEAMPQLAQALAGELGMSVGELRKAGAEGRLTADQVFPALLRASEGVQRQLAGLPVTLEQGTGILTAAMDRFLGQLDQAVGGSRRLAQGLAAAGQALDSTRQALLGPGSQDERFTANAARITDLQARREALNDPAQNPQPLLGQREAERERLARIRALDDEIARLGIEQDDFERDRTARRLSEQAEAERRGREQRRTAAQAAYNDLREQTDREFKLRKEFSERTAVLDRARASGAITEDQFIADSVRLQRQLQDDFDKLRDGASRAAAARTDELAKSLDRLRDQQFREQASEAQRIFEQTRTPAERYAETINRLAMLLRTGAIDQDTYTRALGQAKEALDSASQKTSALDQAAQQLGFTFSSAFEDAALRGARLRDVLQGIAQDIARIILRQTVTEPLARGVTGLVTQAGSFLGGLFGGGTGGAPAAPATSGGGFLTFGGPRAAGGPVGRGRSYLVGEQGPELFVPGSSGTIVPAGGFAMAGGAPVITQHFTIDARGADAGAEMRLRAMVPQIVAAARDGTLDAIRRGGYAFRTTRG